MDNRRMPTPNSPKPFNAKRNYQKPVDKPYGYKKYPSQDERFQPRQNNFQPRNEKFRDDAERLGNRGRLKSPNSKFPSKERFALKGKAAKPQQQVVRPRIVSDLQVTDGKHIGKYLQVTASPKARPTPRHLRETMFKILFRRVRAGRFLDLCAGSGTVGIEAISRGALIGTFVERSPKMCSFINRNLEALNIKKGHGEVVETEVVPFLKQMEKRRRFWDVVYYNPPFDANYDEVLNYFSRGVALATKGVLVIEHPAEMFFPENFGVMHRRRVTAQGDTALSFYERQ